MKIKSLFNKDSEFPKIPETIQDIIPINKIWNDRIIICFVEK